MESWYIYFKYLDKLDIEAANYTKPLMYRQNRLESALCAAPVSRDLSSAAPRPKALKNSRMGKPPYCEPAARYTWKPSEFFTQQIGSNSIIWRPSDFWPRQLRLSASHLLLRCRSTGVWYKPILGSSALGTPFVLLPKGLNGRKPAIW